MLKTKTLRELFLLTLLLFLFLKPIGFLLAQKPKIYSKFNYEIKVDYRFFPKDRLYNQQKNHFPGLVIEPEFLIEWADGSQRLQFTGFARLDVDKNRTHWDIRAFYWQWIHNQLELSVGIKKIFWGVTESIHLVDIINQIDFVESLDGEEKLGQPMAHLSYATNSAGVFDFFVLPYFRRRQFPGVKGRLRTPFLVERDALTFETEAKEWHPDVAFRWSHSVNIFDLGNSYFYGNGREPVFQPNLENGQFDILYPLNHQVGVDVQMLTGAWFWKLESIYSTNDFQNMFALAAGFEFTFSNIKDSGIDIGLIGEYLFDNRDEFALSGLDNDIFIGSRLAFNDVQSTEILIGGIFDVDKSSKLFSIEASRRLGEDWTFEIETRVFSNIAAEEFLYFLRADSFLQVGLTRYF